MKEALLEPILRHMRIGKVINEIKLMPNCNLLDVGCGYNHKFLSTVESYIFHGTGIDFKVPEENFDKLTFIQAMLDESLPFESETFDIVTMLAVLEHLERPQEICSEIVRVLKPGGKIVLTVPGKKAKPVLEFLSFKLGIVNRSEIEDHKKYYDLNELQKLVDGVDGIEISKHKYFQFGMNNFCVIEKEAF